MMYVEPQDFGKVAVLYGGNSAERAVSLESGQAVLEALLLQKIDAYPVDTAVDPIGQLIAGRFDRAFVVLHGSEGEDGTLQGALKLLKIPYTGSDVAACALSMDKRRTKLVWQSLGLATPPFGMADNVAQALVLAEQMGYPVAIKPVDQGSTLGVSHVSCKEEVALAYTKAKALGPVMVERWISGQEYTVGVLNEETLPVVKITPEQGFYDYHAKYQSEKTRFDCPCDLSPEREQALRALGLRAYLAVGCQGWGRIDLVCDEAGVPWLLEVNTVPGMTSHSLVPTAAKGAGIDFKTLVFRILEATLTAETLANSSKGTIPV